MANTPTQHSWSADGKHNDQKTLQIQQKYKEEERKNSKECARATYTPWQLSITKHKQ